MLNSSVSQKRISLENHLLSATDLSRSQILKYIKSGKVKVDEIISIERSMLLKQGQEITLDNSVETIENSDIDSSIDIKIIYEDDEIFVIEKPSGLVVHKGAGNGYGLIDILAKQKNLLNPKIINRLDKETSGLMMISKDANFHKYYAEQFEKRQVKKQYIAVVSRNISSLFRRYRSDDMLSIAGFISRSNKDRKIMYFEAEDIKSIGLSESELLEILKTNKRKERYALTEIQILPNNRKFDYFPLLITLRTGRTHQIRVTLKSLGFPVLGDKDYNGDTYERLMLHSYHLEFRNRQNEIVKLYSELPEVFAEFVTL